MDPIIQIPHSKPTVTSNDLVRLIELQEPTRLATQEKVKQFEKMTAEYFSLKHGLATNSGTNALFLALKALGIKESDEVIMPSFVCISLLNAVNYNNATPVVVDINETDHNISKEQIIRYINDNTKAIIAPHMFGYGIQDIEEIINLGIPVIEDCAQSIGASVRGQKVGSFSGINVCSFYATKVITSGGHGGMVICDSDELYSVLTDLSTYDNRETYRESYNFQMTDMQAIIGMRQLSRLERFIQKRREIARKYERAFEDLKTIRSKQNGFDNIFFRYIIEVDDADSFIKELSGSGLHCRKPVFKPLHHYLGMDKTQFPHTERAYKHCVSVPIYPSMQWPEVYFVIKKIRGSK